MAPGLEYCDRRQRRRRRSRESSGKGSGVCERSASRMSPQHQVPSPFKLLSPPSLRTLPGRNIPVLRSDDDLGNGERDVFPVGSGASRSSISRASAFDTFPRSRQATRQDLGARSEDLSEETGDAFRERGESLPPSPLPPERSTSRTPEHFVMSGVARGALSGIKDPTAAHGASSPSPLCFADGRDGGNVERVGDAGRLCGEARDGLIGEVSAEEPRDGMTNPGGAGRGNENDGGSSREDHDNQNIDKEDNARRGTGEGNGGGAGDGYGGGSGGDENNPGGRDISVGAGSVDTVEDDDNSDNEEGGDSFLRYSSVGSGQLLPTATTNSRSRSNSNSGRRMVDSRGSLMQQPERDSSAQAITTDVASENGNSSRVFDSGGSSDYERPSLRPSDFFLSPHSPDRRSLGLKRTSSAQSLPDVDRLTHVLDITRCFGSEYSSRNSSILLRGSSNSFMFDSPQQQVPARIFDTMKSFDSSDTGRESSILWLSRSAGSGVFDNSPQHPMFPLAGETSTVAGFPPRTPAPSPPFAATADLILANIDRAGEVRSCAAVTVGSGASGMNLLPGTSPALQAPAMDLDGASGKWRTAGNHAMMLSGSDTVLGQIARGGPHGGGARNGWSGRESEEEWLTNGSDPVDAQKLVHGNSNNVPNDDNDHSQSSLSSQARRRSPLTVGSGSSVHEPEVTATGAVRPTTGRSDTEGYDVGDHVRYRSGGGAAANLDTRRWAGLNGDGSWRSEVARIAAGAAGAEEAERRRQAKINEDESWRLDGRGKDSSGARDIRRESISFTRVQDGNVR